MPTRGIPFPAGDPELGPEQERAWRRTLLERALHAVATPVTEPTIFDGEPAPRAAAEALPLARPSR